MRCSVFALVVVASVPLGAQRPAPDTTVCAGRRVVGVRISAAPPPIIGEGRPSWTRSVLRALLQHRTSRPSAVRPFVRLREGALCDPLRVMESERILRAQPYLADAQVRAVAGRAGGVRLEVETVDEIPLVVGMSFRDGSVSKLKYGSSNLAGGGVHLHGQWERGFAYRDAIGGRFVHHHLLGRPIRLTAAGERDQLGHDAELVVERPYYSDFQRTGWRFGARESREYVEFVRPDTSALSLPYARTLAEAGTAYRIGRGAVVVFAGPLATYERSRHTGDPVVVTSVGLVSDEDSTLAGRYEAFERTSLSAVAGVRVVRFLPVEGFDALLGTQDVGVGMQLAGSFGRVVGTGEEGWAAGAELYAGGGTPRSFVALKTLWEGRRELGRWANIVGSGRVAWYSRPSPRQTMILGAEFSGGWRERRPFQLSFADRRGGVRGYDDMRAVGARRLVLRAERRLVVGGMSDKLGLGIAGFADAGKLWAGRVPYGQTTPLRASYGLGLLAAVPRQSRRLLRLDVAVPLARDAYTSRYELRFTTSTPLATFWREPGDIVRPRAAVSPAGMVAWP